MSPEDRAAGAVAAHREASPGAPEDVSASSQTRTVTRRDRALTIACVVAFLALLALLPLWTPTNRILTLAVTACISGIAVYGLDLLYGQIGILSLAHAALQGIGAYTAAIALRDLDVSFWLALPLSAAVAAVVAALLGYPAARVRGHHFVILTFAFGEFIRIALNNGGEFTGGAEGVLVLAGIPPVLGWNPSGVAGLSSGADYYYLAFGLLVVAIIASRLVIGSPFGRTCRAIRENEELARASGIDATRYKVLLFMVSGLFAGVAGVLYAYFLGHISPNEFGVLASVQLVLMLLIGGSRVLFGPLLGVALVIFLPEIIRADPVSVQIVYGAGLIAVILLVPAGLAPGLLALWRRSRGWRTES